MLKPLVVRRLAAPGDRQVLVVREENAIEAARALRDRILANLSHEFQTPLSAQIASIEMLRDHLGHCIEGAIVAGDKDEQRRKASELIELLGRTAR